MFTMVYVYIDMDTLNNNTKVNCLHSVDKPMLTEVSFMAIFSLFWQLHSM